MVEPPASMMPLINLVPTPTQSGSGNGYQVDGSALPTFNAGLGDPNKAKLLGVAR
jgi:hypothetical protein